MIVENLKRSILYSAIMGKLTKQRNNESSQELLDTIAQKFNTNIRNVTKKTFEIPQNWSWIYFGDLVDFNLGKTPPRKDLNYWNKGKYNWVTISDMIQGGVINDTKEKVSEIASEKIFKNKLSSKGTLLMSFKLTIGTCSILGIDSYHNEGIISIYPRIENDITKKYLFRILPFISNLGDTKGAIKGNTLNKTSLDKLPVPLPPLNEQKRIVNKIDEIFEKLDELEPIEQELFELKNSFGIKMIDSVIDFAIKGKMNTGSDNDGNVDLIIPSTDLYNDNSKNFDLTISNKHPFEVPKNWKWLKIGQLFSYCNGYAYKPSESSKNGTGVPIIKSQNIMSLNVKINNTTSFVEKPTEKMLKSAIKKGDFLMCLSSQSSNPEPLGKTAIYELDDIALLNQRVLKLTPFNAAYSKYLYYVMNSFYFHYNVSHKGGGSAQSNLKLEHVMEMEIPFPPLEEQKRIVNKLEELLPLLKEVQELAK